MSTGKVTREESLAYHTGKRHGKVSVVPTKPCLTARDLSMAYTPGVARVCRDRSKIRELYEPSWKAWFPDDGALRNGGPDDPRMVLIAVEARYAQFQKLDRTSTIVLGH